ncbi:hypothetical protein RvY_14418 [Ramazzottius varieornatus]|uniref:Uncharacterized protein n=1 Tax=Ramazzottius varieornatus TaxID=947166 RepID=A0A1D1VR98_RAMVA|nr:hypothetical protein RvY_14418 [Ramazzottius varieornatus]
MANLALRKCRCEYVYRASSENSDLKTTPAKLSILRMVRKAAPRFIRALVKMKPFLKKVFGEFHSYLLASGSDHWEDRAEAEKHKCCE